MSSASVFPFQLGGVAPPGLSCLSSLYLALGKGKKGEVGVKVACPCSPEPAALLGTRDEKGKSSDLSWGADGL